MKLKKVAESYGTLTSFGYFKDIDRAWSLDSYPYYMIKNGYCTNIYRKTLGNSKHYGCFNPYWSAYKYGRKFFFSHPLYPVWYYKVLDEFNNTFDNIKIDILDSKSVFAKKVSKDNWGEPKTNTSMLVLSNDGDIEFSTALLTLELNSKYQKYSDKKIKYFIHHFLRMISITESSYIKVLEDDPKENYVDYVLGINNRSCHLYGYRSLSENAVNYEDFILIDDVDLVNKALESSSDSITKQTGIHNRLARFKNKGEPYGKLKEIKDLELKLGDYVKGKSNSYIITNSSSVCKIVSIVTNTRILVEVISHKTNAYSIGSRHYVNPLHFVKVNHKQNNTAMAENLNEFVGG